MDEVREREPELTLDEQAMLGLFVEANGMERGESEPIVIDGKKWRVRATTMRQNAKMLNLDVDILHWQEKIKKTDNARTVKRLNAKIRKAYAKKAAYKLTGRWRWLIPFYFALTWRRLYNESEKVSATLNTEEAVGRNKDFFMANLGSSKRALVLSTMQVGRADSELQERRASAESMLDKDALPKKEEGGR